MEHSAPTPPILINPVKTEDGEMITLDGQEYILDKVSGVVTPVTQAAYTRIRPPSPFDTMLAEVREDDARSRLEEYHVWKDLRRQERELHRPPTPDEIKQKKEEEEKRQEGNAKANLALTGLYFAYQAGLELQRKAKNDKEYREFKEAIEEIKSALRGLRPPPGPSDAEQIFTAAKSILSITQPVIPPIDLVKEAIKENNEHEKRERQELLGFARVMIEVEEKKKRQRRRIIPRLITPEDLGW